MDMTHWRGQIDKIDERLVELLNKRSRCALEIGKIKQRESIEVYQPDREMAVIRHVTEINKGPLGETALKRLFERIIDESRRVETDMLDEEAE